MSKYKKMKQLIADMRLPEYRYKQLLDAVFLQGIMRFEDMKLLPKTLREKLVEQFGETVVEIKAIHHEKSMQTDKVLFELSDGNRVETVGLFYKEGGASRILCKRTDVVQIEQIISRERSRVQGDRSLGVILAVEMPRVKDQPLNPASCRKRKLRVERGSRSSPGVCRSISL